MTKKRPFTSAPESTLTELPEGYLECSPEDQERVLTSLHEMEVARAEAESRLNRAGAAADSIIAEWFEANTQSLFDAAREDPDTFCAVYDAATRSLEALGKGVPNETQEK